MKIDYNLDAVLKQMAAEHLPELPSPGLIWFRAQIARKKLERERIERPLVVMRWLACVACAAMFGVLVEGNWGEVQSAVGRGSEFEWPMIVLALAVLAASVAMLLRQPAKR